MKKLLRILLTLLLLVLLAAAALFLWLTVTEYKPQSVEDMSVWRAGDNQCLSVGQSLDILSWNIGYCGLGKDSDFFMDGGQDVMSADKATVEKYLSGVEATLRRLEPDIAMLQEVDVDSAHSYGIDETRRLTMTVGAFAPNYLCKFVPYPLPPIGRVNSGLLTTTDDVMIDSAQRIALPCPFSWPVSAANLKRCLLVSYCPIVDRSAEPTGKYLVSVNLHLEAYDDGEGKIAQTKQLMDFIAGEYEKGNYVVAGGDFNQSFPGSLEAYPNTHPELWQPGVLEESSLPQGFSLAYDLSAPSCRLLNQPYDPEDLEDTQYYLIDGFILSPNLELESVQTLDEGFANSDHNPVLLSVRLK